MLTIASRPNDAVLLNLAEHLLLENPPCNGKAAVLVDLVKIRGGLERVGLRVANLLINQGKLDAARNIIAEVNCSAYFQNALNADEVSILFQVLVKLNQFEKVLAFLDLATLSSRFGSYAAMDIRLRIANLLLLQNRRDAAEKVVADLDAQAYLRGAVGIGNINLLFNVLTGTGRVDLCCGLMEDIDFEGRISRFEVIDSRLNLALLLIKENRKGRARNILRSIDGRFYLEHAPGVEQVLRFFIALCDAKIIKDCSELLLDCFLRQHFGNVTIIDVKLKIVFRCIFQGERETAKKILDSFHISMIDSADIIENLGTAFILLEMFDEAEKVFEMGERKQLISKLFYMRRALLFTCLWDNEKLEACIKKDRLKFGLNDHNLYHQASLCLRIGQFDKANQSINRFLKINSSEIQAAGFTLKGNILRTLNQSQKALRFYEFAANHSINNNIWRWIAYFEYGMTLFYMGRINGAIQIVEKGKRLDIPGCDPGYNPCHFLYEYLLMVKKVSQTPECLKTIDLEAICLWPQPQSPYNMWMLFLSATILDMCEDHQLSWDKINSIILNPVMIHPDYRSVLFEKISDATMWRIPEILTALSVAIWPNYHSTSYERRIFHRLCGVRYESKAKVFKV